jgi:hypothetical protein
MADHQSIEELPPAEDLTDDRPTPSAGVEPAAAPATGSPAPLIELTPEEQMALFEKELKEDDWGHQPC